MPASTNELLRSRFQLRSVAPLALLALATASACSGGASPDAPTCPRTMGGAALDNTRCASSEEDTLCSVESGAFRCHYQLCNCSRGTWHCTDGGPGCNDMAVPRDLSRPDLGPTAQAGGPCNGRQCGPNEFCMVLHPGIPNDFGPPEPDCVAVPECVADPTCDCFTNGKNRSVCYQTQCMILSNQVNCYAH